MFASFTSYQGKELVVIFSEEGNQYFIYFPYIVNLSKTNLATWKTDKEHCFPLDILAYLAPCPTLENPMAEFHFL